MSKAEAIEILNQYDVNFEPCPAEDVMIAIDMAVEALESTRWVPVSEDLPKTNHTVFVSIRDYLGDHIRADYYNNSRWEWFGELVTAWMPMMEPYHGGENNEMH